MAELSEDQKTFIVQRLACFDGPQAVALAVKEEFGVEVDRAHVYRYNPLRAGFDLGDRWRELFDATRKAFLEDIADIVRGGDKVGHWSGGVMRPRAA